MFVAAVVVVPQRGRASDIDNVVVVNGPKRPVPVTGNIAIDGTANVKVANTPNVNVTGLPAVQLAGGTTVGISGTPNVNVVNTPQSPVQSFIVNDPARLAFQATVHIPNGIAGVTIPIPAGQRFVIQTYHAQLTVPPNQVYPALVLTTQLNGGVAIDHHLETHQSAAVLGFTQFEGTAHVALYSDVNMVAFYDDGMSTASADLQLSGYLIPQP